MVHRHLGEIQQTRGYQLRRRPVRCRIQHRREHGADQAESHLADRLDAEAAARHLPDRATLVDDDRQCDSQRRKRAVARADEYRHQWVGPRATRRDTIGATQLLGQVRGGADRQTNAGNVERSLGWRQRVAVGANECAQCGDCHRQARRQQEGRAHVGDRAGIRVPATAHLEVHLVANGR